MSDSETYSSFDGLLVSGFRSLNKRKDVEGCLKAEDRKPCSPRRNETLFRGDPWIVHQCALPMYAHAEPAGCNGPEK